MALIVTFTSHVLASRPVHVAPLSVGAAARTEQLEPATASAVTTLAAEAGEDVVELLAQEDCWYAIGADPDAEIPSAPGSASRPLLAGERTEKSVSPGDKVAVIAAA